METPLGGKPTAAMLVVWLHVCMCTATEIQLTFMTPAYMHDCFIRVRICLSFFYPWTEWDGQVQKVLFLLKLITSGHFHSFGFYESYVSGSQSEAQLFLNILDGIWNGEVRYCCPGDYWWRTILKHFGSHTEHMHIFPSSVSEHQLAGFSDVCICFWINK